MKITKFVLAIFLFALLQISCNPECESIPGLEVVQKIASPGTEILIKSDLISDLDRSLDVFFNDEKAEILFIANFGLKVTVPDNTPSGAVLRIIDSDCEDEIEDFKVVDLTDIMNNPSDFIFPSPPNLVIPFIPSGFPPSLSNQWFSPQNPDYCIWFKMQKDPITGKETTTIAPESRELSECEHGSSPPPKYHCNPVSGTLDTAKNEIKFSIDRTSKTLGIEEFTGEFIKMETSGYGDPGIPCPNNEGNTWTVGETMMLITSVQTGRQLLMHRVKNGNASISISDTCTL